MKILVTYYTQTGNTEKIAKAIFEEVTRSNDAMLKKIEDVIPENVAEYDFIFIGSPLHIGNIAEPVKDFLKNINESSVQKMAGFITHAAPAYPEQDMDKFTEPLKVVCKEKGIEFKGCFNCQGFLTESLHEMIKKKQNLTDEQWENMVNEMSSHPNKEDEENAKGFVKELLI